MQESTATLPAQQIPQSSAPLSVSVPAVASIPAPQSPVQPSPQTAAVQTAPAQTGNPWEAAYQNLAASLSSQPTSPYQAAFSAPTQQVNSPQLAAYPSMVAGDYQTTAALNSAQPTYLPQVTPAYSQAQAQQARLAQSQQPVAVRDGYLDAASLESLKVLKHFGQEAPALLNRYSCVLEDALIKQANNLAALKEEYAGKFAQSVDAIKQLRGQIDEHKTVVKAAAEDNAAYHIMLTNPSVLSEYVSEFFGENGPYPVETPRDRLAAEVEASSAGRISQSVDPGMQQQPATVQTPGYQRPVQDIPTPGVQANGGEQFWSQFSQISDKNPAMAWQILNQATPEMLRSKTLVSEE